MKKYKLIEIVLLNIITIFFANQAFNQNIKVELNATDHSSIIKSGNYYYPGILGVGYYNSTSPYVTRSYIKWDISSIPDGSIIQKATIILKANMCTGIDFLCGNVQLYGNYFLDYFLPQNESGYINFNNLSMIESVSRNESNFTYTFQNNIIKNEIAQNLNDNVIIFGFKGATETSDGTFFSTALGDLKLIIEYKDVIPPSNPSNLLASNIQYNQLNLSWTKSVDNGIVAGYEIYRDGNFFKNVTTNNALIDGLSECTRYKFKVRAYDAANNYSGFSNEITVNTPSSISLTVTYNTDLTNSITFNATALNEITLYNGFSFKAETINHNFHAFISSGCSKLNDDSYFNDFKENGTIDLNFAYDNPSNLENNSMKYKRINNNLEKENVIIYPNPVSNIINIDFLGNSIIDLIEIKDQFGKMIYSTRNINQKNQYRLNDLPKGLYIVIIYYDKNVYTEKIILQ